MSKTAQALEKITKDMRMHIEVLKNDYRKDPEDRDYVATVRARAASYLQGICDAGVITVTEKRALFSYITL